MILKTRQIKGDGRGHSIGFPTINMLIPKDFILEDGIYACFVKIFGNIYKGALHYGEIPTFNIKTKQLEVYLLDVDDFIHDELLDDIELNIVEKIRDIKKFNQIENLSIAIFNDVNNIKKILG